MMFVTEPVEIIPAERAVLKVNVFSKVTSQNFADTNTAKEILEETFQPHFTRRTQHLYFEGT